MQECTECQLFTKKTTKAITNPQRTPDKVWEEVNIDLFGPTPNKKHVLVVQDSLSRFPAATMVNSTAAKPVIKALESVYDTYGNPDIHRTDNGPPFNSTAFNNLSNQRGIDHKRVFEYHPQGNPAETFMKPLGKAIKIANYGNEPMEQAINQLLTAYRSTPHPSTGVAPGDMMFRHGYKTDFPRQELREEDLESAKCHDQLQKDQRQDKVNSSCRFQKPKLAIGQRVLIKNEKKRSKFDPMFETTEYMITNLERNGAILKSEQGITRRHHVNDIKPIPEACITKKPVKSNLWLPNKGTNFQHHEPEIQQMMEENNAQQHHSPTSSTQMASEPSELDLPTTTSTRPIREKRPPIKLADYDLQMDKKGK